MSHKNKKNKIKPSSQLPTSSLNAAPKQINTPVRVSFEHIAPGGSHCISLCERDELKEIADCLRQLTILTWSQILQQGGRRGQKVGLAWTPYNDAILRTVTRPQRLDRAVGIGAIRASQAIRVFGGYNNQIFYVLWFDRNHEIVPA